MMRLPEGITSEQLVALTTKHINRYSRMLGDAIAGKPGIRRGECRQLLNIWEGIKEREGSLDSSRYTESQLAEIRDAWFDEYAEPLADTDVDYNI